MFCIDTEWPARPLVVIPQRIPGGGLTERGAGWRRRTWTGKSLSKPGWGKLTKPGVVLGEPRWWTDVTEATKRGAK